MFCPKCGSILLPKKEGKKTTASCSCGYKSSSSEAISLSEEVKGAKNVEVIETRHDLETLPIIDAKCQKCEHEKARFWTLQTRAGDEPETKFMKCVKCGHTWRDYN